jgi:SAM-dependent methyltransferase
VAASLPETDKDDNDFYPEWPEILSKVGLETLLRMILHKIPCRLCGSPRTKNLGKIPDCGEFAGQSITPPLDGGSLMHCRECGSLFRSPIRSEAEYIALYQKAPDTLWGKDHKIRNDYDIARGIIVKFAGGKILDIGCYSGAFLKSLPVIFQKFGIEPSGSASRIAQSRGVHILGKTCAEINPDQQFDIVVAIDVIEHVSDVNEFIGNALNHVQENGLFIVSTGNPDCVFWKNVFKAKFWYNSFSEHLTFPSIKYFACYCKRFGLVNPLQFRFSYLKRSLGWKLLLCISQIIFFVSPAIFRFFERTLRKVIGQANRVHREFGLPAGGLFTDHHLIVIKKERKRDLEKGGNDVTEECIGMGWSETTKQQMKTGNDSLA